MRKFAISPQCQRACALAWAVAGDYVSQKPVAGYFPLGGGQAAADILVADPRPGVHRALVIAGSDRRRTAYGVYELSRRIGVSPWCWWADVIPAHRDAIRVSPEHRQVGPPAVKPRVLNVGDIKPGEVGIEFFLNLAWNALRWRHDNLRGFLEQWAARDRDSACG